MLSAPGGALAAAKVCELIELAMSSGAPLVSLHGASETTGRTTVASLAGYGRILDARVRCSGIVPQIALVMGPWLGPSGFGAAVADVCVMVDSAVNPSELVRTITGEEVTAEALGGARPTARRPGWRT